MDKAEKRRSCCFAAAMTAKNHFHCHRTPPPAGIHSATHHKEVKLIPNPSRPPKTTTSWNSTTFNAGCKGRMGTSPKACAGTGETHGGCAIQPLQ